MIDKKLEELIIQAKKSLTEEEIKDVIKNCSYGGKPVNMSLKGGVRLG